jgi:hypothetical protein
MAVSQAVARRKITPALPALGGCPCAVQDKLLGQDDER